MSGGLLSEFLMVAAAHLLAVMSPGPDFAIVMRQSLTRGRATALWTSLGIGSGILVHATYAVLGLGWVIHRSETVFSYMKWIGTAYLVWLGWQCLRAKAVVLTAEGPQTAASEEVVSKRSAYWTGFLTNALNPKAVLFFVALFSAGISTTTPRWVLAGYCLWMALVTAAWFSLVSMIFTRPEIRARFLRIAHWVDRATGAVLLLFALRLALASR